MNAVSLDDDGGNDGWDDARTTQELEVLELLGDKTEG